jgi:hypothetical protein
MSTNPTATTVRGRKLVSTSKIFTRAGHRTQFSSSHRASGLLRPVLDLFCRLDGEGMACEVTGEAIYVDTDCVPDIFI